MFEPHSPVENQCMHPLSTTRLLPRLDAQRTDKTRERVIQISSSPTPSQNLICGGLAASHVQINTSGSIRYATPLWAWGFEFDAIPE